MLKVKAKDAEDIAVISTFLQDTAIQPGDVIWQQADGRFGFIGQRYCWENEKPVRVNCRFWVDGASAVQRKGETVATLDLLALTLEDDTLLMHFADGTALRAKLKAGWVAYLEDFGPIWPAKECPKHVE